MTTPTYLPNTGSNTTWGSSVEVRLRSTDSNSAIYGAWDPSTNDWFQSTALHSIRVRTDSAASDFNVWSDNLPIGTSDPKYLNETTVGGVVYVNLWDNYLMQALIYQFEKPTSSTASWLTSGSGSGAGTLGSSVDTASFAGTTVQQIQWSITNGSSPTPNANYYLFSETPGGTAKDTINIGSNPQAGATSTDTYQNPSGADFTGRWYIGYGQNATRVNLAMYNFSRGKVFCNFW